MSQDAADAIFGEALEALVPGIPEERIYANRRDSSELPQAWIYGGDSSPGRRAFETDGSVYVHVWAESRGEVNEYARRLRPLQHKRVDSSGSAHAVRFGRPTETVVDEPDAVHLTMRFPVIYVEEAVSG